MLVRGIVSFEETCSIWARHHALRKKQALLCKPLKTGTHAIATDEKREFAGISPAF